jgi:hypothetical protein
MSPRLFFIIDRFKTAWTAMNKLQQIDTTGGSIWLQKISNAGIGLSVYKRLEEESATTKKKLELWRGRPKE